MKYLIIITLLLFTGCKEDGASDSSNVACPCTVVSVENWGQDGTNYKIWVKGQRVHDYGNSIFTFHTSFYHQIGDTIQ